MAGSGARQSIEPDSCPHAFALALPRPRYRARVTAPALPRPRYRIRGNHMPIVAPKTPTAIAQVSSPRQSAIAMRPRPVARS